MLSPAHRPPAPPRIGHHPPAPPHRHSPPPKPSIRQSQPLAHLTTTLAIALALALALALTTTQGRANPHSPQPPQQPSQPQANAAPAVTPTTPSSANPSANPSTPATQRPRIALVLSGGGARGFAHVGVLKALEAARVPIDMVVGTSMGAIIGGLYASGMSPQVLEQELLAVQWASLFERRQPRPTLSQHRKETDFELSTALEISFRDGQFKPPTGAVSTQSLEWLLRRYTLHTRQLSNFDALPTPFRAVATDMVTGEKVVLANGDLAAALRASMSVPGVFAPLTLEDGRILGDGGLVDNLPVSVARQMGADVVIAVNIGTPLASRESLGNVLGITSQMINILTEQNVQQSIAQLTRHDLLLAPPLDKLTSADFDKAPAIAALGQSYADTVVSSLERFAVDETSYARWQQGRLPTTASTPEPEPAALAFVRFDGVREQQASHLSRLVDTRPGQPLNPSVLAEDLSQLAATGDYDKVDYKLSPDPQTQAEGLVFDLTDISQGKAHDLKAGLNLRTDFAGDAGFTLKLNHTRHWLTDNGTEWRNQVQIGDVNVLKTELYHPWGGERNRFVSAHASVRNERIELFDAEGNGQAIYRRRTVTIGADHGWTMGRGGRTGAARIGVFHARRQVEPELVGAGSGFSGDTVRWSNTGLHLNFVADQLDYANFPQSGYRVVADSLVGQRRNGNGHTTFHRTELKGTQVFNWDGKHTLNVFGRLGRSSQLALGTLDEFSLGGFQQLSGYKVGQVAGNYLGLLRLDYYQKLSINPGMARAFFAGGSVELGNAWNDAGSISLRQLKRGTSLYLGADTGFGPFYLGLVHAKGQATGLYLFMGRP